MAASSLISFHNQFVLVLPERLLYVGCSSPRSEVFLWVAPAFNLDLPSLEEYLTLSLRLTP